MTHPSPSSPPLGVSNRMMGLVDELVSATHDQAPQHEYEAAYRALLTAIAALEAQVPQWQPIETAPKDTTWRLLYNGYWRGVGNYREQNYDGDPAWFDEIEQDITPEPTHWMPLPPSPTGR